MNPCVIARPWPCGIQVFDTYVSEATYRAGGWTLKTQQKTREECAPSRVGVILRRASFSSQLRHPVERYFERHVVTVADNRVDQKLLSVGRHLHVVGLIEHTALRADPEE
jgi:hypothetical protein